MFLEWVLGKVLSSVTSVSIGWCALFLAAHLPGVALQLTICRSLNMVLEGNAVIYERKPSLNLPLDPAPYAQKAEKIRNNQKSKQMKGCESWRISNKKNECFFLFLNTKILQLKTVGSVSFFLLGSGSSLCNSFKAAYKVYLIYCVCSLTPRMVKELLMRATLYFDCPDWMF